MYVILVKMYTSLGREARPFIRSLRPLSISLPQIRNPQTRWVKTRALELKWNPNIGDQEHSDYKARESEHLTFSGYPKVGVMIRFRKSFSPCCVWPVTTCLVFETEESSHLLSKAPCFVTWALPEPYPGPLSTL
jgi:hypothetical protein